MAVAIPFPLPSTGFALNSKMRVNLDFIVSKFNEFNTGSATWDMVAVGTANDLTGTLTFYNASNANYIQMKAGTTATSYVMTLPTSDTAGLLKSNGSGTLSFTSLPSLVNGTTNRVSVTDNGNGTITLSAPQNLDTEANVTFAKVTAGNVDATNGGVFGAIRTENGSTLSLAVASNTDSDTGFYFDGDGGILFYGNDSAGPRIKYNATSAMYTQLLIPRTVPTYPAIALTDDDNTGVGAQTANTISLIAGNTPRVTATTSGVALTGTTTVDGSLSANEVSAPSIILTGGANTTIASAASSAWVLTLPTTAGTNHDVLTTDGSGNTSWVSVSSAGGATSALDNLASVAINTSLVSDTDSTDNLGSSSVLWNNVYARAAIIGNVGKSGSVYIFPPTASKGKWSLIPVDNSGDYTLTLQNAALGADRTYTIPEAGAAADFVMTAGTQTIAGVKSFTSAIKGVSKSTNADNTLQLAGDAGTGYSLYGTSSTNSQFFASCRGVQIFGTNSVSFSVYVPLVAKGTTTNDSAATGYIGEYKEASVTTASLVSATGTDQAVSVTSLLLSSGDWDVAGLVVNAPNGSTQSEFGGWISLSDGNSFSNILLPGGHVSRLVTSAAVSVMASIPSFRVSLDDSTTIYLKAYSAYSAGTPKFAGYITARRAR